MISIAKYQGEPTIEDCAHKFAKTKQYFCALCGSEFPKLREWNVHTAKEHKQHGDVLRGIVKGSEEIEELRGIRLRVVRACLKERGLKIKL